MIVVDPEGQSHGYVAWSHLEEKFRGMGLARKLYGEAARRHSFLWNDGRQSPSAKRVWTSLARRPCGWHVVGDGQCQAARLPAAARAGVCPASPVTLNRLDADEFAAAV